MLHQLAARSSRTHGGPSLLTHVMRAFPTPRLLAPVAAGVDISDVSLKWLSLVQWRSGWKVAEYGTGEIERGIVENGTIRDVAALSEALRHLKREVHTLSHAHAALPEEAGYVFSMKVPKDADRLQIMHMIEFQLEDRVPLSPLQAVYDYDHAGFDENAQEAEIAVTVFPREIAESYVAAFDAAGIELLSLEIEARSIARAISPRTPVRARDEVVLLADFGRARTGLAVIKNGVPIFTSTVAIGGDMITKALMDKIGVSAEEAEKFKNEHGIFGDNPKAAEAIRGAAAALADEISRIYFYWDTKRDERGERIAEISRVVLAGGSSNLSGLPEYVAERVQLEVDRAEMWGSVCLFDEYIPPIERRASFSYATAIGLALRSAI